MKKTRFLKRLAILPALFLIASLFLFAACAKTPTDDPWDDAIYRDDVTFGSGSATVEVEIAVNDHRITVTLHTNRETLGDALSDHGLIEGEPGPYGLYVKKVNGITADFNVDQSYWALTKNGEMTPTGVDGTAISDGEHYELVYTR